MHNLEPVEPWHDNPSDASHSPAISAQLDPFVLIFSIKLDEPSLTNYDESHKKIL
jgi:hypothetical protein